MVGDTWLPTASMKTLKYFLLDATKHKARFNQLYCIGEFLEAKVKNIVFLKLDSIYTYYFPEYLKYLGRSLRSLNYVYGMTNFGNLFDNELTEWLLETYFILYQCKMYIYYKYAPDGSKIVVLSYVNDCVYWYTSEAIGKWFVGIFGKRFYVNFLGYAHWFMSIRISQMKDNYISLD